MKLTLLHPQRNSGGCMLRVGAILAEAMKLLFSMISETKFLRQILGIDDFDFNFLQYYLRKIIFADDENSTKTEQNKKSIFRYIFKKKNTHFFFNILRKFSIISTFHKNIRFLRIEILWNATFFRWKFGFFFEKKNWNRKYAFIFEFQNSRKTY